MRRKRVPATDVAALDALEVEELDDAVVFDAGGVARDGHEFRSVGGMSSSWIGNAPANSATICLDVT